MFIKAKNGIFIEVRQEGDGLCYLLLKQPVCHVCVMEC